MKGVADIFKDPEHQRLFDTQGYVKLKFLNDEQVAYLDKLFDELHPELPEEGFYAGSYFPDFEYKKRASDEIVKVFSASNEKIFKNYTAFGASFLFKMPSENSDLVLHQDWTIVDETQAVAINCWVPLCDTSVENGTLMVLPGAHHGNFPVHRAPTLNFFFTGKEKQVMKQLVPMNAKAGEAVILNQSLVHYSPPNISGKIRKAITAGIKTKGAPMQFFYKSPDNESSLDVYDMDENFLIMFDEFGKDIFQAPIHGVKRGTLDYTLPQPKEDELDELIQHFLRTSGIEPHKKESFFGKLKKLVGLG